MPPVIFSRFNTPPPVEYTDNLPDMCQQHFKEECDINNILKKFTLTGLLPNVGPGVYADITEDVDYRTALETIMNADEMFSQLPSTIRKEFDNDPAKYLDFVHNPANLERGIELGIFQAKATIQDEPQLQNQGAPIS